MTVGHETCVRIAGVVRCDGAEVGVTVADATVFQLVVYGAAESVPIVVQVDPPAGARSKTTC